MRVLLDTNVWRYLVDTGLKDHLFKIANQSKAVIFVAPTVVIETLRLSNCALRREIIELQTRACWKRLMPDAYLQCEAVKTEMLRFHPEWGKLNKDSNMFRKLRHDWIRRKGGFWDKARNHTHTVATKYAEKDSATLNEVRDQLRDVRKTASDSRTRIVSGNSLNGIRGSWKTKTNQVVEVEAWRVYALLIWTNMLSQPNSPFRQWIGCDIEVDLALTFYAEDFTKFWELEISSEAAPREWLRFAAYAFQSERKFTDGNPVDSAIATHLVDVDFFVSADKNFIDLTRLIRRDAPFETANGCLICAESPGIEQLFDMLSRRFG